MKPTPQGFRSELILSLEDDEVWASWPGEDGRVYLGPLRRVIETMRHFVATTELADRMRGDG